MSPSEVCSLNGIVLIFPRTLDKKPAESLSFNVNNLQGELRIAQIRAAIIDYA